MLLAKAQSSPRIVAWGLSSIDLWFLFRGGAVVFRRHRRANIDAPCDQTIMEFLGFLRMGLGQVLGLANVLVEVVEFQPAVLEELHELPLFGANGANRSGAPSVDTGP